MKLFQNPKVFVEKRNERWGVFAVKDILPGEIIEQSIVLHPEKKNDTVLDSNFLKYCYSWMGLCSDWNKKVDERGYLKLEEVSYPVLVLGNAMIYAQASDPNVAWEIDSANDIIEFRARRKILADQELFILRS